MGEDAGFVDQAAFVAGLDVEINAEVGARLLPYIVVFVETFDNNRVPIATRVLVPLGLEICTGEERETEKEQ